MSLATLRQLQSLLNKAIDDLEATSTDTSTTLPDLNEPFTPQSEAFRSSSAAAQAAEVASAAAYQIAAILAPPHATLYQIIGGPYKAAALRVCLESGVTEILREAGPKGLYVKEIAAQMARFLRVLATHHVYREVQPNVFANNRISSMLDTLKLSKEILADPEHRYDNAIGLAAITGHHLDEICKGSSWIWETVSDPATGFSGDPKHTPLACAFGFDDTIRGFYSRPEQKGRHHRFNVGLRGIGALQTFDTIVKGFPWGTLPRDSVVVDVGGGIGTAMLTVAKEFPDLKVVVQSLPNVIQDGKGVWATSLPEALSTRRVTLQTHDFFTPQPQKNAAVFFVKHVLHDWSDERCKVILSHLREAATPQTKLYVIDTLIPFACRDRTEETGIPGAIPNEAPEPLLANYGAVNNLVYSIDMVVSARTTPYV
ncbi:hypothetical protein AX16_004302 [Volvariella volvacea WC 439]|nr:hypothetical protein AX16_004302 [Volvariella volvacea WC 439]